MTKSEGVGSERSYAIALGNAPCGISFGGWLCEVAAMFRILASLRIFGVASAASLLGPSEAPVPPPPPSTVVSDLPVVQPVPAPTPQAELAFQGYVQLLAARARADGVSEPTIRAMTADLTLNPRVIALEADSGMIPAHENGCGQ